MFIVFILKKALVLSLLLLSALSSKAQYIESAVEWKPGGLTLGDYRVSIAMTDKISNSSFCWLPKTDKIISEEEKYVSVRYIRIKNYFIANNSWIREGWRNIDKLQYEQLKFDVSELYARKASRIANITGESVLAIKEYEDSLRAAIRGLDSLTLDGSNKNAVDSIRQVVSSSLQQAETIIDYYALQRPARMRIGLELNAFEKMRMGRTASLLKEYCPYMSFSIFFGAKRWVFSTGLSAQVTGDWLQNEIPITYKGKTYPAGFDCEDISFDFIRLKYALKDKGRFRVYPYAGGGLVLLDFRPNQEVQNSSSPYSIPGWQIIAGMDFYYTLFGSWLTHINEIDEYQLDLRVFATRDNIAGFPGYSINFGLGFTFGALR